MIQTQRIGIIEYDTNPSALHCPWWIMRYPVAGHCGVHVFYSSVCINTDIFLILVGLDSDPDFSMNITWNGIIGVVSELNCYIIKWRGSDVCSLTCCSALFSLLQLGPSARPGRHALGSSGLLALSFVSSTHHIGSARGACWLERSGRVSRTSSFSAPWGPHSRLRLTAHFQIRSSWTSRFCIALQVFMSEYRTVEFTNSSGQIPSCYINY